MVESIVLFLINILLEHKIINSEIDVYTYGLELIISSFFCLILSIIAGILFNCIFETCFFLLCFILLRLCSGGFHASTHFGCWATMLTLTLSHIFIFNNHYSSFFSLTLLDCVSIVVILLLAPVENNKKPLLTNAKGKLKLLSVIISILFFSIAIILTNKNNIAITLHYVNITDALLILLEEVKK